jgi:guanylate kinase
VPELYLPVPMTTRPAREPERPDVHYEFVDRSRFAQLLAAGELLEWAELGGHWYGTARAPVVERLRAGRPVLMALDPAGAAQVRRAVSGAMLVLLAPPARPRGAVQFASETDLAGPVEFDLTVTVDSVVRAADQLVGLLGSPVLL